MKHWHETRAVLDRLAELRGAGRRAALATSVRARGSAYRHEGAKLLVADDGSTVGNVSGGCLEQDVREVALQVLASGTAELKSYCSSTDEIAAWDLGVGCEGQVDVLVEPVLEERARERELLDGRVPFVVCTVIRPGKGEGRGSSSPAKRLEATWDPCRSIAERPRVPWICSAPRTRGSSRSPAGRSSATCSCRPPSS